MPGGSGVTVSYVLYFETVHFAETHMSTFSASTTVAASRIALRSNHCQRLWACWVASLGRLDAVTAFALNFLRECGADGSCRMPRQGRRRRSSAEVPLKEEGQR
jgi:hypothetical protein